MKITPQPIDPRIFGGVCYSRSDIKRGITPPKFLTTELAEFMGILMGDGHLGIYIKPNVRPLYGLEISGDMNEDKEYFPYFARLFRHLFCTKLHISFDEPKNTVKSRINSKAILTYFRALDMPIGNKNDNARVPKIILRASIEVKSAFLRGIADTDFSLTFKWRKKTLHSYPVIQASFKSPQLVADLCDLLASLGIHYTSHVERNFDMRIHKWDVKHSIYIRGHENLLHWMNSIGFSNKKHMSKYEIFKTYGMVPPNTTLLERKYILAGLIRPEVYYKTWTCGQAWIRRQPSKLKV